MPRTLAALALAALLLAALAAPAPAQAPGPQPDAGDPPPFLRRPAQPRQAPRQDLTYASRPAPSGFRGLLWGTPLAQAQKDWGLTPVSQPLTLRDTYARADENLTLGQGQIRSVAYYFPKGVLRGVGIVIEGESNFALVRDHLIDLYGPGRQIGEHYGWTWPDFNIDMRLHGAQGELRFTHEPTSGGSP